MWLLENTNNLALETVAQHIAKLILASNKGFVVEEVELESVEFSEVLIPNKKRGSSDLSLGRINDPNIPKDEDDEALQRSYIISTTCTLELRVQCPSN